VNIQTKDTLQAKYCLIGAICVLSGSLQVLFFRPPLDLTSSARAGWYQDRRGISNVFKEFKFFVTGAFQLRSSFFVSIFCAIFPGQ